MKYADLAALGDEQLVHKELELERALVSNTFRLRLNQLENTSVLKSTRRDIARAQTILTSRERDGGLARGSLMAKYRGSWTPSAGAGSEAAAGEGFLKGILDSRESAE
jgi:ribosomal protein L29